MRYFDLHADTIGKIEKYGENLRNSPRMVSLDKAACIDEYIQVFAVFIPDALRGEAAVSYFDRVFRYYKREMAANGDIISSYSDKRNTKIKSILAVESGAALNGSIDGFFRLREKGVKILTLTWNGENELGSGAYSEPGNGLAPFGIEAVKKCEELDIVVDVSHLSVKGFYDVARVAEKPFIASHSGCDIAGTPESSRRNLSDGQIKCLIKAGGLMGLTFHKPFLGTAGDTGRPAVLRHINRVLELGGEDILAIGSDFDGGDTDEELKDISKIGGLYEYLNNAGLNETILNKIFYKNPENFFKRKV
ncbi:MAG: membrane dipeptidase [Oscillospiraceae bacterium]|nr:membrane dipeptidase [Oscillospiraceae bacterium]